MYTTNVPPPTFSANGFVAPLAPAILAGVQADMQTAFGGVLNFTTSANAPVNATPQAQLATSLTAIISEVYQTFQYYCNQVDPSYAQGRMQDAIGRIYFMTRKPSLPTVVTCACSGDVGVEITQGSLLSDGNGFQYYAQTGGSIGLNGSVSLGFANTQDGPNPVPSGPLKIVTVIPGWDSATVTSGAEGQNQEGRAAFEARRQDSVASNSFGAIGSIIGAVAGVSGVLDYWGYDNFTSAPVTVLGQLIPANSVFIAVVGGSDHDVASAIFSKKPPGCGMAGNTSVSISDSNPIFVTAPSYAVTFDRPPDLQIFFAIDLVASSGIPSNAATLIQNAIIGAFAGSDGGPRARIGSLLLASRYVEPIEALGSWAQVRTIKIGSANNADALFTGTVSGNVLNVTYVASGTIVVGDSVVDQSGLIPPGTVISSLGSGSGGTGTYNLSASVAIPGASFTGSGSGTTLTVSAVTGTIDVGDYVQGTGVPAGTTILSQLSGTPGGAGTYRTSDSTTSSGASLTSSPAISAVDPDLDYLQVNVQEPVVQAANVAVTAT